VGIEKLDIAENQDKSEDRKCPDDPRKSFIGHPDAMQFLRIYDNLVFQQPRLFSSIEDWPYLKTGIFSGQTTAQAKFLRRGLVEKANFDSSALQPIPCARSSPLSRVLAAVFSVLQHQSVPHPAA
jgi:hypothetical protein